VPADRHHVCKARLPHNRTNSVFFNRLPAHADAAVASLVVAGCPCPIKPWASGTVDHRRLGAPAMHIAVLTLFVRQQLTEPPPAWHHVGVGLPDKLTAKNSKRVGVNGNFYLALTSESS